MILFLDYYLFCKLKNIFNLIYLLETYIIANLRKMVYN